VFFLLRACLWIGAVILLVPMLPSMQGGGGGAPSPTNLAASLPAAISATVGAPSVAAPAPPAAAVTGPSLPAAVDVVRFCLDNGTVCEAGFSVVAALGDAVGQGLEFAATLQNGAPPPPGEPPAAAPYDPPPLAVATTAVRVTPLPPAAVGTLTAADRAEPWIAEAAATAVPASLTLPAPRLPLPDPRRRPAG
jgi:hypothetical protein